MINIIGIIAWFLISLFHLVAWAQTEEIPMLVRFTGSGLILLSYMLEV